MESKTPPFFQQDGDAPHFIDNIVQGLNQTFPEWCLADYIHFLDSLYLAILGTFVLGVYQVPSLHVKNRAFHRNYTVIVGAV
jgi:hypothetical protein